MSENPRSLFTRDYAEDFKDLAVDLQWALVHGTDQQIETSLKDVAQLVADYFHTHKESLER